MNLNKQQKQILEILKQNGNFGMNSYDWRQRYIQLPVRIKELKEKGYSILSHTNKNRSVNYILTSEPKEEIKPQTQWIYEGNIARQIEIKPKQQLLFNN